MACEAGVGHTGYPDMDLTLANGTYYAVLKGRSNYACLHRIREGVPDDQGTLVEVPQGSMASKVLELRAWAEEQVESKGRPAREQY